jgi:heme exporter protein A
MMRAVDLACTRGGVPVIEGVNMTLGQGHLLVLRGPNGIGKTTLLRSLAGLQPPAAGRVEVAPDSIAYAAHADGLKAQLTVAENLAFWDKVFGADGVNNAVQSFDLEPLLERRAAQLSAGQKRRLGLARLLVTGRPIWILDEPTVSLDAAHVARFADAVRAHLAKGGSALIATHIDLGLEAEVFDLTPYKARQKDIEEAWEI